MHEVKVPIPRAVCPQNTQPLPALSRNERMRLLFLSLFAYKALAVVLSEYG